MNREKIEIIAKTIFQIDKLKEEQMNIIENFVNKKDIFATLATGFGKSICYQIPAILTNKVVIIISPLIALMEDQAKQLQEKNINVICLNSLNKNKSSDIKKVINQNVNIVYTSPEYIVNNQEIIEQLIQIDRLLGFAVDETHCVHQWSDDTFRPIYKDISTLRLNAQVPIMAVTASCSNKVRSEIMKMLNLNNPYMVKSSFYRKNLRLSITLKSKDIWFDIKNYIDDTKTIIVYVRTIDETEKICRLIRSKGYRCTYFHGNLTPKDKQIVLNKFLSDEVNIIVATVAFGLGINKIVHTIIQYGMSPDLDTYYQEIGRGGRNGIDCECICFYGKRDIVIHKFFITKIENQLLKQHKGDELNKMIRFISSNQCRWKLILEHLNEEFNKCGTCDNCSINLIDSAEEEDPFENIPQEIKKKYNL
jgi:ATP-dependent DNA helicase RecQ